MQYVIFISVGLVVSCLISLVSAHRPNVKLHVPAAVRAVALSEALFGVVAIFSGVFLVAYGSSWVEVSLFYVFTGCFFGGLLCILLSVRLSQGSRAARTITLGLSVLRVLTVVGIPFSLFSLLLLLSKEARSFYGSVPHCDEHSPLGQSV